MKTLTPQQLEYFRQKLIKMRQEVLSNTKKMLHSLQQETQQMDCSDVASQEANWITECSLLSHEQNMLNAIDAALERIENKTYGYCEDTQELISLKRLEAYPTTTLNVTAQKECEKRRHISIGGAYRLYR